MPIKYKRKCNWCKKEYKAQGVNFCGTECYYKSRKGIDTLSKKQRIILAQIVSEKLKGRHLSPNTEFKKGNIKSPLSGSFKKGNTNWKLRVDLRGDKHPNWKGGVTPLRKKFWDSIEYGNWRKDCFKRDNYTCQECGKSGYLEVHHKKERVVIWNENNIKTWEDVIKCKELWERSNGITLCKNCHNKTKKGRINYVNTY